jgi:cholesterol transport system auxiliary component
MKMKISQEKSKAALFFYTVLFSTLLFIAGCSVVQIQGPPPNLYNLTPKSTFSADLPDANWQLVIEPPVAAGGLDSRRIALRPSSTELKYFSNVRWTERAPEMFQTLLIESFENTGKIVAVGRQSLGLRSDYNLKTELREFQAETYGSDGAMTIRVRLNAKIVQFPRRSIVGSQSFEYTVKVKDTSDMAMIVQAFDEATGKVLKKVVQWTLMTAN